jgi:hypothetical protein
LVRNCDLREATFFLRLTFRVERAFFFILDVRLTGWALAGSDATTSAPCL